MVFPRLLVHKILTVILISLDYCMTTALALQQQFVLSIVEYIHVGSYLFNAIVSISSPFYMIAVIMVEVE